MASSLTHERSKISIWIQSVRPFAFPASIIPVLVGTSISLYYPGNVDWFLFPIILICSMLLHGGTNMINDYYDFKKGVDKEHTYGSSRVIVEKLLLPEQVKRWYYLNDNRVYSRSISGLYERLANVDLRNYWHTWRLSLFWISYGLQIFCIR